MVQYAFHEACFFSEGNGMLKQLLQVARSIRLYRRFTGDCYGCFRGVFASVEEAAAAAPRTKPIGYDNPELAQEYKRSLDKTVRSYDYPILFWLEKLMKDGVKVFDLGGNVGIHFYAYERYLNCPPDIRWTVCDLPAIVKAGEELAHEEGRTELAFTCRHDALAEADIFLASGSIQYIESLAGLLAPVARKPAHLLINRLPLYDGKPFVTLQNGGQVFYPQYVFNKTDFIASVEAIGYTLVDIWEDTIDSCIIPFHRNKSLPYFHGVYFKAVGHA
ncbi:MAG: hypothetical protein NVSMB42_21870 [Herpetosiphon sp.]